MNTFLHRVLVLAFFSIASFAMADDLIPHAEVKGGGEEINSPPIPEEAHGALPAVSARAFYEEPARKGSANDLTYVEADDAFVITQDTRLKVSFNNLQIPLINTQAGLSGPESYYSRRFPPQGVPSASVWTYRKFGKFTPPERLSLDTNTATTNIPVPVTFLNVASPIRNSDGTFYRALSMETPECGITFSKPTNTPITVGDLRQLIGHANITILVAAP